MRVRQTSQQAYMQIMACGIVAKNQALAWATLRSAGKLTASEIGKLAKRRGLWRRLSELRSLGLARECGTRVCAVTGITAVVWEATMPTGVSESRRQRWYMALDERRDLVTMSLSSDSIKILIDRHGYKKLPSKVLFLPVG